MDKEQIKKALERDIRISIALNYECPRITYSKLRDALALIISQEQRIKELTEENESLRAENEASVDDLKQCMYYAKPKSPNTCNFCIHDCEVSKDGTQCKGKDDWIYCTPVWRGVVKVKAEGE